jgi:hypothetical protein
VKTAWRLAYSTTITAALAGLGAIAYCVAHNRPTLAIGSLAAFLVAVIAFRMVWEIDVLHRRRMRLAAQERGFEADRGVFEQDKERAMRDLTDRERAMRDQATIERKNLRREIEAERDRLETDLANKKALIERKAVQLAFQMAENGIAEEQRPADVIVLPVGQNAPTIMGTGTTHP